MKDPDRGHWVLPLNGFQNGDGEKASVSYVSLVNLSTFVDHPSLIMLIQDARLKMRVMKIFGAFARRKSMGKQ